MGSKSFVDSERICCTDSNCNVQIDYIGFPGSGVLTGGSAPQTFPYIVIMVIRIATMGNLF